MVTVYGIGVILVVTVYGIGVILVVTVSALRYRSHSGGDSVSVTVQESFWW